MQPPDPAITRRAFLRTAGAAAGALALPRLELAVPQRGRKTQRVILVAFAGGVRQREVLGTPQNVPNLMRIAKAGVTFTNARAENSGHFGATLSLFTGNVENLGIREQERGIHPTVFECLAKDAGLDPAHVWLSTAGGPQARLYAYSDHPAYGAAYGANVLDGDGILNVEFQRVLESFGKPRPEDERDAALLRRFDAALHGPPALAGTAAADPERLRRIERFLLDELAGKTARVTGPGAADAKAIRLGANILRVFAPKVVGIALQGHDIAHGSYNGYVEVIRRNDEELGKLWDAVQQDRELRDTTAIFVVPEFGRDAQLNQRNGLDHGDDSADLHRVFAIAAGPDFRKGHVSHKECRTIDVAPTVYSLFSPKPMAHASARALPDLFA